MHKGMLLCEECFDALKRFPNSKASGNDGLTLLLYTSNFTIHFDASSKELYQLPSTA